jgi:DnaJ-class molecular chaperone
LNPGDKQIEEKFKAVQEAYEVLSDPKKRERYDRLGANWKAGSENGSPPDWQDARSTGTGDWQEVFTTSGGFGGAGFGDERGDGFSDFFESLFGSRGRGTRTAGRSGARFRMAGRNIEAEASISLAEAHRGTRRSLTLEIEEACPTCGGSGSKDNRTCPTCNGRGARPGQKTLEVTIPAGVRDGTTLRLSGQGEPGSGGGPPGDLLVHVHVQPHSRFRLVGADNLLVELPVAPWEAVLGAKVSVETLDGRVDLTIPPGSQGGQKLRLRGQGLRRRNGGSGDLLVQLTLVVPTRPTPEERELFQKLADVSPFKPRR